MDVGVDGKIVLVTGGTQGVGRAIALEAARSGADGVMISGRNARRGAEAAAEIEELGAEAGVRAPASGVAMLSYLDAGLPPLSPAIIAEWNQLNGRVYSDVGDAHQIGMWVNRLGRGTTVSLFFPVWRGAA